MGRGIFGGGLSFWEVVGDLEERILIGAERGLGSDIQDLDWF